MITDVVLDAVHGPWALIAMALLVLGDAFFVVVPGEIAVTAIGALSISSAAPPLWAVIAVGCRGRRLRRPALLRHRSLGGHRTLAVDAVGTSRRGAHVGARPSAVGHRGRAVG